MIVISSDLVLSAAAAGIKLNHPVIGWRNVVVVGGISATTEEVDFPASNLANPATNLKWRGEEASPAPTEYITIATNQVDPIDYVGVARHNWGSAQIAVTIGYWDNDQSPPAWVDLVEERMFSDDTPAIFRFTPQSLAEVVIRLVQGLEPPEAAVIYCGLLLVMERGFPVTTPHTPINLGRETQVVFGESESGNFLGRIVVGEHTESVAEFQYLTAAWYRSEFIPFVLAAKEIPFFIAWKPVAYPRDVGFAWLTASPKPVVDHATERMSISLPMRGVA